MSDKMLTVEQLIKELDKFNHKELHVHHTWKPAHKSFNGSNHQAIQDGMRTHHVKTNKWSDIAQHVTLFPDGTFLTGRSFGKNPASISGYNSGAFCVEMVGNFDKPGDKDVHPNNLGYDKFEGKQREAMLKLANYFINKKKYIRFHRENAPKTCPGTSIDKTKFMSDAKNIYNEVKEVKKEVPNIPSLWAKKDVEEMVKNGYTDGSRLHDNITRQEAIVIVNRLRVNLLKEIEKLKK